MSRDVKVSRITLPVPINKAITRFRKASEEMAWIGSKMPEDHEAIVQEYERARDHLRSKFKELL